MMAAFNADVVVDAAVLKAGLDRMAFALAELAVESPADRAARMDALAPDRAWLGSLPRKCWPAVSPAFNRGEERTSRLREGLTTNDRIRAWRELFRRKNDGRKK